jgi:type VI secretion system protein ImpK
MTSAAQPDPSLDDPTVAGHRPRGSVVGRAGAPSPPSPVPTPASPARRGLDPPAGPNGAVPVPPARPGPPPRPVPGAAPAPPSPAEVASSLALVEAPSSPDHAIVAAAVPILVLIAQLRDAVDFADVQTLRQEVVHQIQKFEERAVKFGAKASDVMAARYVLCSLVDETVMTTPWGSASNWSENSLLNRFHNETWGGEKVFQILERVKAEPKKHLALLKLIDVALSLGFEGMHRVVEGGRDRLADLRAELGQLIASYEPAPKPELSEDWQGVSQRRRLTLYIPLWVVFAVVGLALVALYGVQRYRLSNALAPVEQQLRGLAADPSPAEARRP